MATITSNGTGGGLWSATSTWAGGVVPGDGDLAVVAVGDTVTGDQDVTLGSNSVGLGNALTVFGIVNGFAGYTLTLKGTDVSGNKALSMQPGGLFSPADGATVEVDLTSDGQTGFSNNGDIVLGSCTVQAKAAYDISAVGRTITNGVMSTIKRIYATGAKLCCFPLGETTLNGASVKAVSPIANAAGTGIGSFGDTSFSVVSCSQPSLGMTNPVASLDLCVSEGDYYVDHGNGMLWYIDTQDQARVTCEYTANAARWRGFRIWSGSSGDSKFVAVGTTFRRIGFGWSDDSDESNGFGIYLANKVNGNINANKEGRISGCLFEYCQKPIQVYYSTNTATHPLDLTDNTYRHIPRKTGLFPGVVVPGYSEYIDFSGSAFDCVANFLGGVRTTNHVTCNNLTGRFPVASIIRSGMVGCVCSNCVLEGYGGLSDSGGLSAGGSSTAPNTYTDNEIYYNHRAGRVGPNMVITGNLFVQCLHHGFVGPLGDGYRENITVENNRVVDSDGRDMDGGWTLGYNYKQWLHNVRIANNTFSDGQRGISFNDGEGTIVLGTKMSILNNIVTGSDEGINRPDSTTSNATKMQLEWMDYNDVFDNGATSNVAQATFAMSSAHYGSDEGNCIGVALFNPSDAPNASGRDLVMVIGSASLTLAWGGGPPVQLVDDTGTVTTGGNSSLSDSSRSWSANEHICKYVRITSGAAAGQVYMIYANTATGLILISNDGDRVDISIGDAYEIVNSEVILTDSGANTVHAGLHLPDVPTTPGTYTDSGITIEDNSLSDDPQFVSAGSPDYNYAPTNAALAGAGYDGSDIGALAVTSAEVIIDLPIVVGLVSSVSVDLEKVVEMEISASAEVGAEVVLEKVVELPVEALLDISEDLLFEKVIETSVDMLADLGVDVGLEKAVELPVSASLVATVEINLQTADEVNINRRVVLPATAYRHIIINAKIGD